MLAVRLVGLESASPLCSCVSASAAVTGVEESRRACSDMTNVRASVRASEAVDPGDRDEELLEGQ